MIASLFLNRRSSTLGEVFNVADIFELSIILVYSDVRWQNSGTFVYEAVAGALRQANRPEFAVGLLFLTFNLFTIVVF